MVQKAVVQKARSPAKILIVDDAPSNLRFLSRELEQAGYNVRNAHDGNVAIMDVATNIPDLILLDIQMPALDGFSVCRHLHKNTMTADIPIIFMSAFSEVPSKLRAFELGAVDYITKPFQIPEVLARIEHQLELRNLRQTLTTQNQKLRIILRQYEISETQVYQINHELERRVLERTKALKEANHNLQQEMRERRLAQTRLMHLAMYDSLTGLPNRTLLIKSLEDIFESEKSEPHQWSALLMLDCDRFKNINDTLGHLCGDQVLIEVANRISTIVPEKSVTARLADDKFAILLPMMADNQGNIPTIASLVKQLQKRLEESINIGDHEITMAANVGIVLVSSTYRQAEHVLRDASLALLQAKQKPCGWRLFHPKMHEQALHRLTLEGKLRQALRQQQLQVFYQPIVALESGAVASSIVGYEALVRWQPEGTSDFLSPADFIPLAEESDLISQLGNWIFRRVCEQLHQWSQILPAEEMPFVSVNFSVRHLQDDQFTQQIHAVMQQTRVDPAWLKFEITENLLIDDTQTVLETLSQLRRWGIQISIDDFGTGYSSLNYLKQLPVDTLKIDRAFIKDMQSDHDNLKIVEAIVHLAQVLNLEVVAEGIETRWQAEQLLDLGCTYGQGFFFSQPLDDQSAWSLLEAIAACNV